MNAPPLEDLIKGELFFVNQLKGIMEKYGIYHDVTGNMIDRLSPVQFKQGVERIRGESHPYVYDSSLSGTKLDSLLRRKREMYSTFLGILTDNQYSGFFAEAIVFLALCKAFSLYGSQVGMHILQPEQRWINGVIYKIEFPINIAGEVFGFEVKNNYMQLSPKSEHISKLLSPDLTLNPVLINRQSTRGLKSELMRRNGRVADLTHLLLLQHEDSRVVSDLQVDHIVKFLPEVKVREESYNGVEFKENIHSFNIKDLVEASFQVPIEVQEKINGLIALLYLSTRFRQAQSLRRGNRAVSMCLALLLQNAYAYLLGAQGEYRTIEDCFAYAASKVTGVLKGYLIKNLASLKQAFYYELEDLKTRKLVKRRLSRYRVKGLTPPENWLRQDP